jgi:hypothetical protein
VGGTDWAVTQVITLITTQKQSTGRSALGNNSKPRMVACFTP